MRLTYLDEGGTSQHEPYAVVAGPIVHGDHQLAPVEQYLGFLLEKHVIPEGDRSSFVFHAKDIWSGGKYFKDEKRWPLRARIAILEDLADIPAKFGIPVAFGVGKKALIHDIVGAQPNSLLDFVHYASAFTNATQVIERYFLTQFSDEYTLIIAEDRQKTRNKIKRVQAALQGRGRDKLPESVVRNFVELPYNHIRDTVHFAGKAESPLLQVADTCAFVIRGACAGHPKNAPLLERLMPALLDFHKLEPPEEGRRRDVEG